MDGLVHMHRTDGAGQRYIRHFCLLYSWLQMPVLAWGNIGRSRQTPSRPPIDLCAHTVFELPWTSNPTRNRILSCWITTSLPLVGLRRKRRTGAVTVLRPSSCPLRTNLPSVQHTPASLNRLCSPAQRRVHVMGDPRQRPFWCGKVRKCGERRVADAYLERVMSGEAFLSVY